MHESMAGVIVIDRPKNKCQYPTNRQETKIHVPKKTSYYMTVVATLIYANTFKFATIAVNKQQH